MSVAIVAMRFRVSPRPARNSASPSWDYLGSRFKVRGGHILVQPLDHSSEAVSGCLSKKCALPLLLRHFLPRRASAKGVRNLPRKGTFEC